MFLALPCSHGQIISTPLFTKWCSFHMCVLFFYVHKLMSLLYVCIFFLCSQSDVPSLCVYFLMSKVMSLPCVCIFYVYKVMSLPYVCIFICSQSDVPSLCVYFLCSQSDVPFLCIFFFYVQKVMSLPYVCILLTLPPPPTHLLSGLVIWQCTMSDADVWLYATATCSGSAGQKCMCGQQSHHNRLADTSTDEENAELVALELPCWS